MSKSPYHITIRPWVPRRIPYEVTQEMLNVSFAEQKDYLLPFVYLGWRRIEENGKREIRFCLGHGKDRASARMAFKGKAFSHKSFFTIV